jgi:hypothetical protein
VKLVGVLLLLLEQVLTCRGQEEHHVQSLDELDAALPVKHHSLAYLRRYGIKVSGGRCCAATGIFFSAVAATFNLCVFMSLSRVKALFDLALVQRKCLESFVAP